MVYGTPRMVSLKYYEPDVSPRGLTMDVRRNYKAIKGQLQKNKGGVAVDQVGTYGRWTEGLW